ncbi:hypothetical protein N657DRAFT_669486 [Parathielavia appendiculata]|uniref:Uncharacterized protein n=1 Tax=Parathielavia appendiculata TaxID=2587402 RepID=A0AAN6U896_9PEZI|nr:hypothetical protein N657DRAFT_669486 [Parathielavia appendiculata]
MDLELSHIPRAVGAVIRILGITVWTLLSPVIGLLHGCFWVLKAVLWSVFVAARILISPLLVPWYITQWCWETALVVYEEFRPLLVYWSFSIYIGAITGVLIVVLTNVLMDVLHYYIPWLAPAPQPQPQLQRNRRASAHRPRHYIPAPQRHPHVPRGQEEEGSSNTKHARIASPTSGSESDKEEESWNAEDALSRYSITPPAGAKTPWRRGTPPAKVRVEPTIHEESSG